MSTTTTEKQDETTEMGTKPMKEHEWLKKLVGNFRSDSEMYMGPGQTAKSTGTQKVKMLGDLWAVIEGTASMPNGATMEYYFALGYDVSFKEYRGCRYAAVSSHLWNYRGSLSPDGKTLTLDCVGPNMFKDGETANYRDVIEIIDDNHRTITSYGEDENGQMQLFMKGTHTRV